MLLKYVLKCCSIVAKTTATTAAAKKKKGNFFILRFFASAKINKKYWKFYRLHPRCSRVVTCTFNMNIHYHYCSSSPWKETHNILLSWYTLLQSVCFYLYSVKFEKVAFSIHMNLFLHWCLPLGFFLYSRKFIYHDFYCCHCFNWIFLF